MRNHAVVNAGTKVLFPKDRVWSPEYGYDPHIIRLSAAGSRRGAPLASKQRQGSNAVPSESLKSRPSADEHSNGMAAAMNFSGRCGSDFCGMRLLKLGLRTRWAPSPACPFTGKKVMEISKRYDTNFPAAN